MKKFVFTQVNHIIQIASYLWFNNLQLPMQYRDVFMGN